MIAIFEISDMIFETHSIPTSICANTAGLTPVKRLNAVGASVLTFSYLIPYFDSGSGTFARGLLNEDDNLRLRNSRT